MEECESFKIQIQVSVDWLTEGTAMWSSDFTLSPLPLLCTPGDYITARIYGRAELRLA